MDHPAHTRINAQLYCRKCRQI